MSFYKPHADYGSTPSEYFFLGFFEDPFLFASLPQVSLASSLSLGLNKQTSSRVAEHLRCSFLCDCARGKSDL